MRHNGDKRGHQKPQNGSRNAIGDVQMGRRIMYADPNQISAKNRDEHVQVIDERFLHGRPLKHISSKQFFHQVYV